MSRRIASIVAIAIGALIARSIFVATGGSSSFAAEQDMRDKEKTVVNATESIVLGGGCFWCIEAIFQGFKGVGKVESGYSGGAEATAHYEAVGYGNTGHAEVVRVYFDPQLISLDQILTIFFHAHDPTTLNRQGNDVGSQYRSAIFYSSPEQKIAAERVRDTIAAEKIWGTKELVTEISPLKGFFRAEDYHQNYYANNPSRGYCSIVIAPKVQKIRREFSALLAQ